MLTSILATVLYLSFSLRNDEAEAILGNNIKVVGKICRVGIKTVDVMYEVDNKAYFYTTDYPHPDIMNGEEFVTLAYKKDLNRALVYFDKPILDTLVRQYARVKLERLSITLLDRDFIRFSYVANGVRKRRRQKVNDNRVFKDEKKFEVLYRVNDVDIAYVVYKNTNSAP